MAILAIPNPKKSLSVDFPLTKVKQSVTLIPALNSKYKLHESTEAFNQYTFAASETLSLGSYVDINLSSNSESKTDITIEVRRKIGTFDESREATKANEHISLIVNLIAKGCTLTQEQIETLINPPVIPSSEKSKGGIKKRYIVLAIVLIILFLLSKWGPFA